MEIRKAAVTDIDAVENIYEKIHDAEEKGLTTIGWIRGVYPTRKTAEDALKRQDLFVMENDGQVVAAAIINQISVKEYADAPWEHKVDASDIMVLHALVVDPDEKKKGFGRAFVSFYEDYALHHNCRILHMDTQQKNTAARNLYHKLGYTEVGVVNSTFNGIPGVKLVCLEKCLKN